MQPSIAFASLLVLVSCGRPEHLPASIPDPLVYYFLNDGSGFNLKDSVSGKADAGRVIYDATHQSVDYTEPNWVDDERFGKAIQCGGKEDTNEQKDTLQFMDVDYGHSGAWSLSVWFRHDADNFADKQREQFIGHGDPGFPTTSQNQFHVQMENSAVFRTIVYDGTDYDRYDLADPNHPKYSGNPDCADDSDCRGAAGGSTDTRELPETHEPDNWHHFLFTTRPDGEKGYNVYIDGVLESGDGSGKGTEKKPDNAVNGHMSGRPTNPEGPLRMCGRAKPAEWDGGEEGAVAWDPRRYFLGKVAHFALWDSAMTQEQVTALIAAYDAEWTPIGAEEATDTTEDAVEGAQSETPAESGATLSTTLSTIVLACAFLWG